MSVDRHPSSGPSDHLLPQGEKGRGANAGNDVATAVDFASPVEPTTEPPSPLAGEGARRAGEGFPANRSIKSPDRLKNFAKTLRRRQTEPEQRLWGILRNRRFSEFKFRRQVPLGPYIVDFVCYEVRLIVEIDGSQHAESARDQLRDKWLGWDGYRVLRIWNNDLTQNRDGVLEAIWHALQESRP